MLEISLTYFLTLKDAKDVAAAHALRERSAAPLQSKFRVSAVLRFVRGDGSQGTVEAKTKAFQLKSLLKIIY